MKIEIAFCFEWYKNQLYQPKLFYNSLIIMVNYKSQNTMFFLIVLLIFFFKIELALGKLKHAQTFSLVIESKTKFWSIILNRLIIIDIILFQDVLIIVRMDPVVQLGNIVSIFLHPLGQPVCRDVVFPIPVNRQDNLVIWLQIPVKVKTF